MKRWRFESRRPARSLTSLKRAASGPQLGSEWLSPPRGRSRPGLLIAPHKPPRSPAPASQPVPVTMATDSWALAVDEQEAAAESVSWFQSWKDQGANFGRDEILEKVTPVVGPRRDGVRVGMEPGPWAGFFPHPPASPGYVSTGELSHRKRASLPPVFPKSGLHLPPWTVIITYLSVISHFPIWAACVQEPWLTHVCVLPQLAHWSWMIHSVGPAVSKSSRDPLNFVVGLTHNKQDIC